MAIYDFQPNASPFLEHSHCGDSLPPSQISSSNHLVIYFHSDGFLTKTGFKLEYNATSKNQYKIDQGRGLINSKAAALPKFSDTIIRGQRCSRLTLSQPEGAD